MTDATLSLSLSLISEHRILDKAAGLNEPSGLTLNHDGSVLYTVSDDTKAVFRLDLKGRLSSPSPFSSASTIWKGLPSMAMAADSMPFRKRPTR